MTLSNSQYEKINRKYEILRDTNRDEENRRLQQVYSTVPQYKEMDDQISSLAMEKLKASLAQDAEGVARLKGNMDKIISLKAKLLLAAGFPADFLEPVYVCKECKDTGYVASADGLRSKCKCFINQEIEILYDQSNIRNLLKDENFSKLSYNYYNGDDLANFKKAVAASENLVCNFGNEPGNLFFYGTVGTGKSFLSGCVAKEILDKGFSVIYFSSIKLFDELALYSFGNNDKKALYDFHEDLYNCDLMIIDDLGTEVSNSFVSAELFALLNERQLRKKSTIISTNLFLEEFGNRYSDRIFSRITSNYTICKMTGPDIRAMKKFNADFSGQRKRG